MSDKQNMRGVFERPRGSGIFWINYYDADGHRHREKIGRESVAIEAYLQRRVELKEGKYLAPRTGQGITFKEIAAERTAVKTANLSALSLRADKYRLRGLLKVMGSAQVRQITPQKIEEALNDIAEERGVAGSTLNRYRTLLSSIFTVAVRNKHMVANPIAAVTLRPEPSGRIRFLSDKEEKKLRKEIRARHPERVAEFDLAISTGLRRAEQFNLTWAGVDLERKHLLVMGKGSRGRGPKRRFVPINELAAKALRALYKISNGSPYVCPRKKREGQRDFSKWYEQTVRAAGIPDLTWHDIRHTFASRLVMAGVDMRTVGELLGHSSIQTTMRYAHLSQEHRHAAVSTLDRWHQDGTKKNSIPAKYDQVQSFQQRRGTQEV